MKYVLDTNTASFVMNGEPSVCERLISMARTDIVIPGPAVAEIQYGLARIASTRRRRRLAAELPALLQMVSRAPWTDEVSRAFGRVKAALAGRGQPIEDFDVAIASHALALDAVLVTDNTAHMGRIPGLRLENWRTVASNPG